MFGKSSFLFSFVQHCSAQEEAGHGGKQRAFHDSTHIPSPLEEFRQIPSEFFMEPMKI